MKFGIKKRENSMDSEIDVFRRKMTRLFDDYFDLEPAGLFESKWTPAIDVAEDDQNIYVKADLPGLDEKDIGLNIERNILTISGEKEESKTSESEDKRQIISERNYGSYRRSIGLPDSIKVDAITAKFKNGVLNVKIPKVKAEKAKTIKIDVK